MFLFARISTGVKEISQWVTCLLHKHVNWVWVPRVYIESQARETAPIIAVLGDRRTPVVCWLTRLAESVSSELSEILCLRRKHLNEE